MLSKVNITAHYYHAWNLFIAIATRAIWLVCPPPNNLCTFFVLCKVKEVRVEISHEFAHGYNHERKADIKFLMISRAKIPISYRGVSSRILLKRGDLNLFLRFFINFTRFFPRLPPYFFLSSTMKIQGDPYKIITGNWILCVDAT